MKTDLPYSLGSAWFLYDGGNPAGMLESQPEQGHVPLAAPARHVAKDLNSFPHHVLVK